MDPVIEEVRRIRHEISAEFGHDIHCLAEDLREYGRKLRASGRFRYAEPDAESTRSMTTDADDVSAPAEPEHA